MNDFPYELEFLKKDENIDEIQNENRSSKLTPKT